MVSLVHMVAHCSANMLRYQYARIGSTFERPKRTYSYILLPEVSEEVVLT